MMYVVIYRVCMHMYVYMYRHLGRLQAKSEYYFGLQFKHVHVRSMHMYVWCFLAAPRGRTRATPGWTRTSKEASEVRHRPFMFVHIPAPCSALF